MVEWSGSTAHVIQGFRLCDCFCLRRLPLQHVVFMVVVKAERERRRKGERWGRRERVRRREKK